MWSVGISASPCCDAKRMGYDNRQINRIIVRAAQFFLNQDMQVIFGHDWREDGVMRAVAEFANKVVEGVEDCAVILDNVESSCEVQQIKPRMINVVPTGYGSLSRLALEAERDGGGVLEVVPVGDEMPKESSEDRASQLEVLREKITERLNPGVRVCLGGKEKGYEGREPGVIEEARLALEWGKPLYLLGGFGGATRLLGEPIGVSEYWKANNGLEDEFKRELFETTDIEHALRIIAKGIRKVKTNYQESPHRGSLTLFA